MVAEHVASRLVAIDSAVDAHDCVHQHPHQTASQHVYQDDHIRRKACLSAGSRVSDHEHACRGHDLVTETDSSLHM